MHALTLSNAPQADPDAPGTRRRSPVSQVNDALKRTVWHRDGHSCRFCGFRSQRYLEVVAVGGNARDVDHLLTACQFCHQCVNLPEVARMRSGVLLWLPELTQRDLHHVARDIYVARLTQRSGPRARHLLDDLLTRRAAARERLGTDDPRVLAERLATDGDIDSAQLEGIRLLPLDRRILSADDLEFNQFPQVLAYWRSSNGPYHGEREFRWMATLEQLLAPSDPSAGTPGPAPAPLPPEPPPTYAALGVRLLRDAASFFRRMAESNPGSSQQLTSSADNVVRIADRLEQGPLEPMAAADDLVKDHAARYLENAADLFDAIASESPLLAEQMKNNAETFRDVAYWVRTDPLSGPDGDD